MKKETKSVKSFENVVLSTIQANPLNPRKNFEGKKFEELIASVRKVGVIEPVLLRPIESGKKSKIQYEIIAGERRFRAMSQIASEDGGLDKNSIPSIIQAMSDDDAFDLMTIENLQREDLSELEEAESFKIYLEKKGKEALPELAERTGINPQYINRRVMVMSLPKEVLKAWGKGEIKYGHCEQLIRLKDKKLTLEYLARLKGEDNNHRDIETVKELKGEIDEHAIPMKSAKFNIEEAGCLACQSNTDCQAALFEEKYEGVFCTNATCFKKHQGDYFTANWKKYGKHAKTNGFRFRRDLNYNDYEGFNYRGDPGEKCKECCHLISLLTIEGKFDEKQACVGDKTCFNQIVKAFNAAKQKEENKSKNKVKGTGQEDDSDIPRVSWHGQHFREEFHKVRIPEIMSELPVDDYRCLCLSLMAMLKSNHDAEVKFAKQWLPEYEAKENLYHYEINSAKIWDRILHLNSEEIVRAHRDIAREIIMQSMTFTPYERYKVGKILNIDLATEWRITKEYLDKKTTKEILAMIVKFGIDKDTKAQAYLHENLNKKRGRFDTCKKSELVSIFLDSGIDLSGKVPTEILISEKEIKDEEED